MKPTNRSSDIIDALAFGISALMAAPMPPPQRPASRSGHHASDDAATMSEFDALMNALDLGLLNRVGWERFKAMLIDAMLEVNGDDEGLAGYLNMLPKWRRCRAFDGRP